MAHQSVFSREIHPIYQAGVAMVLNAVAILVIYSTLDKQADSSSSIVLWEVSFSVLLGFMLFNAIFSIPYNNRTKYFRDSIFSYMGVALVGGLLATYFSGLSMDEAGHFRWMYLLFTFTYLVFISIVNMMRKIVEIAKKQDARLRGEDM